MTKKAIDFNIFKGLCEIHCTKEEICHVLNLNEKTLTRICQDEFNKPFKELQQEYSSGGKVSLRRWQFESAKRGNVAMLIFLGKQYLGQSDKVESAFTMPDKIEVNFGSESK